MQGNKTVFLDRDGVINKKAGLHEYIKKWDEFEFLPGVLRALYLLKSYGYYLIIITNQRGVARNMMDMDDVNEIHNKMCTKLALIGIKIDGIYVCPHGIGECTCRKPEIGLFLQAEKDFEIDKEKSWMIGDSFSDIAAGKKYGIKTIFIGSKNESANFSFCSLLEAAAFLGGQK